MFTILFSINGKWKLYTKLLCFRAHNIRSIDFFNRKFAVHVLCRLIQVLKPITYFSQVADSCAAIVGNATPAVSVRRSESRSKEADSRRSDPRRDDIDKVYQSENYKMYSRRMPRHRRGHRDPKTPDRKSSASTSEWNEKISAWKSDLYQWNKKRADTPTSRIKDTIVKNDLVS